MSAVNRGYDVLDLFAGSGVGAATQALGLREIGVETMPEAIETRRLNGLETMLNPDRSGVSVADLKAADIEGIPIHAAGPPCQTFSMAGKGAGRQALDRVLTGVDVVARGEVFRPGDGDPRTWLVLEPLRLALAARPMYLYWEQVPPVMPVWEACADVLRTVGYSVWTGFLTAEMYGVPQTRRRAKLIARRDGIEAGPPVPTHSRFHNRDPQRLDEGMAKWVSMAEALGWGMTHRPYPTIACSRSSGGPDKEKVGGTGARKLIYDEHESPRWIHGPGCGCSPPPGQRAHWAYASSTMPNATVRELDHPAPTVAFGNDMASVRWVYRNGNTANAARRPLDQPAPTVMFGARSNKVEWEPDDQAHDSKSSGVRVTVEEAAILQSFPPDWVFGGSRTKQFV